MLFKLSGLERGEKCIYVVDINTAQEIEKIFLDAGVDLAEAVREGQFVILHERDTYTREGFFDPDLMISLLASETEQALREGYPALRVTGEMSWALRGYAGAEKLLEYEAKLNRDFFPHYPCVALCQYDRWKFDPAIIRGVVLTHPLLIRGGQIYRNFYYIEPDEYLNHKRNEREVQHWLNNLERERKIEESLKASEEKYRQLFEASPVSLWEEDFSLVKKRLDQLKAENIGDLRSYLLANPDLVKELAGLVKIVDVNQRTIKLYKAKSKHDFFSGFAKFFADEPNETFIDLLVSIADSRPEFYGEETHRNMNGEILYVKMFWSVAPGFEESYGRVLVSFIDITKRKEAEELARKSYAELETLHKVSTALRKAQTLEEMLPLFLDEVLKVFATGAGAICLYDLETEQLRFTISRGWFSRLEELMPGSGKGIAGKIGVPERKIISRDFSKDQRLELAPFMPAGWGGACLPLRAADQIIGTVFVSVPLPREITAEEENLLTSLVEMASTAIHRIYLHEKAIRRLKQLQAAHAIDLAISSNLDLQHTMHVLLEHVVAQPKVAAAAIFLLNPHLKVLEYAAGKGFNTESIKKRQLRLGDDAAVSRAAMERRTIIVSKSGGARGEDCPHLSGCEGFSGCINFPLIARGKVIGVLAVFLFQPHFHDSEQLGFLEILAGQASIAIDSARLFEGLQRSNRELTLAYDAMIESLARSLELRDYETEGHSRRVAELTVRLAQLMELPEERLIHIYRGALLHDIGKMAISDHVLLKAGKLTDEEFEMVRRHPQYAFDLLSPVEYLRPALNIPYCHHERFDGSGYPRGLKGEEIPLEARIFAVADVFDALTSNRPYRKRWTREKALAFIQEQRGKHFDPQVVDAFLREMKKENE